MTSRPEDSGTETWHTCARQVFMWMTIAPSTGASSQHADPQRRLRPAQWRLCGSGFRSWPIRIGDLAFGVVKGGSGGACWEQRRLFPGRPFSLMSEPDAAPAAAVARWAMATSVPDDLPA